MRRRRFCVFLVFVERKNECKRMIMKTGKISLVRVLSLLVFLLGFQSVWADVWDGVTKTPAKKEKIDGKDFFLIESAANLVWFSDTVNKIGGNVGLNAKVVAEYIDLDNHPFTPIAAGKGGTLLTGVFDGNGVTIANVYIDSLSLGVKDCSYEQNVGLIGVLGPSGTVKNVVLENVHLGANADRGYQCGAGKDNQISVGPIVGWVNGGTVSGCYASGIIYSKGRGQGVGGIVGTLTNGKVIDCLSIVSVNASGEDGYIGGIAGYSNNGTIITSVYDGNSLVNTQNDMIGGIVGKDKSATQEVTIELCYYDSDVAANGVADAVVVGQTPIGVSDANKEEYVCKLNGGTWISNACSEDLGVWSNEQHITNQGVSKDSDGETVFVVKFEANGGVFPAGAKTHKVQRYKTKLTADEISTPTYENKVFLGWSLKANSKKADDDLGYVYGTKSVYAVWRDQVVYTVTFDHNTGEDAEKVSKQVVEGETITTDGIDLSDLPTVFTVGTQKYYFDGWSTSKNGGKIESFGVAAGDATFYARWTLYPQFTVSFNMNGHGEAPAAVVVSEGDAVDAPVAPTAEGYVFGGWFKEAVCKNVYNFKSEVTENVILYAKWTPVVYKILYNLGGGTNDADNPSSYTIETSSIVLKAPVKEGYEFKGWFYDGAYTNKAAQITQGSTGDKTLYAMWAVKTYKVVYNGGSKSQDYGFETEKIHGVDLTLRGAVFTAAGYTQDGWATQNDGAKVYELGALYSTDAPIVLYPHWAVTEYTVTYHLDGGVNHVDNPVSYNLNTAAVNLKNPTKVGYDFGGWYAAEDFSGSKVTKLEAKSPYGNKDFYAKWTQKTVTVKVEAKSCEYNGKSCGAKVTVLGVPSGYKAVAVTDSIKNVNDGPIEAKIVGFVITDNATGDTVTTSFNVVYQESGSVTVTPRNVSFEGKDVTKTYTGSEIHVESKATPTGLLSGHTHNVGYEITATDAGSYQAVMTAPADVKILDADGYDVTANYNVTDIKSPTNGLVINPKSGSFTIKLADENVPVGGSIQGTPTSTAASGTTTFSYQVEGDGDVWVESLSDLTLPTTPGTYTINIKASNPNYTGEPTTTAKITITALPIITVIAASESKVYDGSVLVNANYTCPECATSLSSGDVLSVTMNDVSVTNVGSVTNTVKTVKVTNSGTDVTANYAINKVAGTLTVTKAPLTITTASDSKVYDGTPLTAGVTAVFVNGETATVTATGSQTLFGSSKNTYTITWDGSAAQGNYQIVENLGTLTVTKASATITVVNASKLYGEADPVFTGNVTGVVNENDLGSVIYFRTNLADKDAGTYANAISASYTANPNYNVNIVKGKLTITKRSVSLTSATLSKVYDGTALTAPTVTVGGDGFAPNEGAYYTVTGSQTDVGSSSNDFTYKLIAGTDTSKNYTVAAPVYGTLTVTKAPVTVTVVGHSGTYAYNGATQVVSGYDISIDNALYSVGDIAFSGDSVIQKSKSGTYAMGLSGAKFANKNSNFNVTFDVTDGSLTITSPVVVVSYNDAGDTLHVVVNEDDSDSLISEKINAALASHVPPIPLPTKAEDADSTYDFDGWKLNPGTGMYEPDFEASVKLDTIKVKYQDNPEKFIDVTIHTTDVHKDIVQKINKALEDNGIALPSKESDGDSTYVLDWKQNPNTGVYEPDFKGELIVEKIVVKYGDNDSDTLYVDIRAKDTKSQINQKINEALNNHLPPIKVEGPSSAHKLVDWEKNKKTGYYEPVFAKGDLVFKINFHLPEGAELTEKFNGYNYGEVTMLPDAVMKSDTTWVFKGWYTKPKGRGDRIRSMRETDSGNKSLYPLFQKTIRYDANGVKGEIEVIYTDRAEVTITRALDDVIPANYTKGKSTFAFDKWVLKDGVYTATFKKVGTSFNVYASARGFTIEEAKLGARLMVLDLNGKVVKRGVISNESQRVEVPKSGSYTVRVGKQAAQVNVK